MKSILVIVAFIIISATAVVTCPTKQMHKEAFHSVCNSLLSRESRSTNEGITSGLVRVLGSSLLGYVLDEVIVVDNYFLFSVARIGSAEDKESIISVGVFNHVFTCSEDELYERMMQVENQK